MLNESILDSCDRSGRCWGRVAAPVEKPINRGRADLPAAKRRMRALLSGLPLTRTPSLSKRL